MRVLFISSFLLFGDSRSGAAKRLHYFSEILERECELSLISLDAGSEADAFDAKLSPCARFLQVRYERSGWDKLRDPFNVPAYLTPEMQQELARFIGAAQYDVVFCAFAFALSLIQLPALRAAKNIVYLEDDLSFEVFRERMQKARQPHRKLHMAARLWQAESFYGRLLPRVRSFVSISEEEAKVIVRKFPHLAVVIVGYGIPMEEYPPLPPPADPMVLGFIGNYIHQSNIDAMRHFLESWYPLIKQKYPGVVMHVAGKNLPPALSVPWAGDPALVFRDNVPDLRKFCEDIAIFVNPIVSQRGLRTKLVEAAAFGRPIISTELGAEGLDDLDTRRADSAEEFVKAFESLQDEATYRAVSAANRTAAEQIYSIEAVGRTLVDCLRDAADLRA